jgi:hypothetical protein
VLGRGLSKLFSFADHPVSHTWQILLLSNHPSARILPRGVSCTPFTRARRHNRNRHWRPMPPHDQMPTRQAEGPRAPSSTKSSHHTSWAWSAAHRCLKFGGTTLVAALEAAHTLLHNPPVLNSQSNPAVLWLHDITHLMETIHTTTKIVYSVTW